ncbi:MAG TPA: ferrochelatase [Pirellulales bacterium]|nr:ferrochelatase [Pirellulales bacterium]
MDAVNWWTRVAGDAANMNVPPPDDYDALLVVSFGGPEKPDDVIPFLENVLRGKNVPRERMLAVAEHYDHFGGVSPINAQNRALVAALQAEFDRSGPPWRVYWGNRNWHPLLPDTLAEMARDGVRRALAFFTSAYSSYSGCRQYRENIQVAQQQVGSSAPAIDKLRMFYNHPLFIEPQVEYVRAALEQVPPSRRPQARIAFTAHSIPLSMAQNCLYEPQLQEACRLVSQALGDQYPWQLVYQSRSGAPSQPWLEPDIRDHLAELHRGGVQDVVVVPIGFVSDHLEILYDLDTEAREVCDQLGMNLVRASTVGTHPKFISMICELVQERLDPQAERRALGSMGPSHDECAEDCCPLGAFGAGSGRRAAGSG